MLLDWELQILMENLRFVRREGKYLVFFCPFHRDESKPNLKVHIEKRYFRCFADHCGEHGPISKLLSFIFPQAFSYDDEKDERIRETLEKLSDIYRKYTVIDEKHLRDISERRGLSIKTLEEADTRFLPGTDEIPEEFQNLKRRYLFPVYNFSRSLVNTVGWTPYQQPHYVTIRGIPPYPYGVHFISEKKRQGKDVTFFLCEGVMDALSFIEIGKVGLAILGSSLQPHEVLSVVSDPLTFVFDGDTQGHWFSVKYSFASIKRKRTQDVCIVPPDGEDPNSLLRKGKLDTLIEKGRKWSAPEVLFLYSVKHPDVLSPTFVLSFIVAQLPFTFVMDFMSSPTVQKHVKSMLKGFGWWEFVPSMNGNVPDDLELNQILQILPDWNVIKSAFVTEGGRKIVLEYFLPSEIEPLLKLPVMEGGCSIVEPEIRSSCRRLLYILRKDDYNSFKRLIETIRRLEGNQ